MVEAALAITTLLLAVMFLIEMALAVFRYAILVHSVSHIARQVAIDTAGATNGQQLVVTAPTRAVDYIVSTFSFDANDYEFTAGTFVDDDGRCHAILRGQVRFTCSVCRIFDGSIKLRTESQALIEDECFTGDCA